MQTREKRYTSHWFLIDGKLPPLVTWSLDLQKWLQSLIPRPIYKLYNDVIKTMNYVSQSYIRYVQHFTLGSRWF
ncbi:Uncharacterized protein TCM_006628 [Theobroma cacao]|uniref:Uncharacterized protein n=1 Tax=Theobroma cacao TaxID=3641 RepID=A0A061E621_THECC|nr:Uncharacterized protein TCM_006628 [Theobroma cacao]